MKTNVNLGWRISVLALLIAVPTLAQNRTGASPAPQDQPSANRPDAGAANRPAAAAGNGEPAGPLENNPPKSSEKSAEPAPAAAEPQAAESREISFTRVVRPAPKPEAAPEQGRPVIAIAPSAAPLNDEMRGVVEVALQGYYLGGSAQTLSDTSGIALRFQNFIPHLGLLSGTLEGYGRQGRLSGGENSVQLRGLNWKQWRWTLAGGDFGLPSGLVQFPAVNISFPEVTLRGFQIQAERRNTHYSAFYGVETLRQGPRIPFRVSVPQSLMGVIVTHNAGKRLALGARFIRLRNDVDSLARSPYALAFNSSFHSSNTLSLQARYQVLRGLKVYGEAGWSAVDQDPASGLADGQPGFEGPVPAEAERLFSRPFSFLVGTAWESKRLTVRANYVRQSLSYLPLLGYFAGDRRGPYLEALFKPFKRLELNTSASRYENNLERNSSVPNFRSNSVSVGGALTLPWKLSANGQLTGFDAHARGAGQAEAHRSINRQANLSLSRPFHGHAVRISYRQIATRVFTGAETQKSVDVEDSFRVRNLSLTGGARMQRLFGPEPKSTVYLRGAANARFNRFALYADFERGNDLINRTIFTTSNFQTTVFGASVRLSRDWNVHAEAFRNRLISELNPQNVFLMQSQGVGVSTLAGGFNQWSFFFRVSKQLTWGGGMPAGGLDQYAAEQIPLLGSIEGFVQEMRMGGPRPAASIPVVLDTGAQAATDENGRYRFVDIPEGVHRVMLPRQELPADYDFGQAAESLVDVRPKRIARADLEVVRLAAVSGKVNGPDSVPPEDILVRLLPGSRYTTTDRAGNFAFHNLPEGDYEVVLDEKSLPENGVVTGPARVAVAVRVEPAAPVVEFEFDIRAPQKPVRKVIEEKLNLEDLTPSAAPTAPVTPAAPAVPAGRAPAAPVAPEAPAPGRVLPRGPSE